MSLRRINCAQQSESVAKCYNLCRTTLNPALFTDTVSRICSFIFFSAVDYTRLALGVLCVSHRSNHTDTHTHAHLYGTRHTVAKITA